MTLTPSSPLIPRWLKVAYTAFMAVLIPVYWWHYGLSNFLYFCDVALLLTLAGVWTEKPLLISLAAVGILLPQGLWCADFIAGIFGFQLTGMTDYMFEDERSLFLRGLSLFHGWFPFMLLEQPDLGKLPVMTCWPEDGGPFISIAHYQYETSNYRYSQCRNESHASIRSYAYRNALAQA